MTPRSVASRQVQVGLREMPTLYTLPVEPSTTKRW